MDMSLQTEKSENNRAARDRPYEGKIGHSARTPNLEPFRVNQNLARLMNRWMETCIFFGPSGSTWIPLRVDILWHIIRGQCHVVPAAKDQVHFGNDTIRVFVVISLGFDGVGLGSNDVHSTGQSEVSTFWSNSLQLMSSAHIASG